MKTFLPYFKKTKLLIHTQDSLLWECKTVGKKQTMDEDLQVVKSGYTFLGVESLTREEQEREQKRLARQRRAMRNFYNKTKKDKTIGELKSAVSLSGNFKK